MEIKSKSLILPPIGQTKTIEEAKVVLQALYRVVDELNRRLAEIDRRITVLEEP